MVEAEEKDNSPKSHSQAADNQKGLSGSFLRPIKITMLGAGSMFTPRLLNDVLLIPNIPAGEIALVDIDETRLKTMHQLIEKLIEAKGAKGWTVTSSTDRKEVMAGSHYLTCCMEVAGLACVKFDNDIPLKYGVDQCIGDTIGPGGLFKALRTVPVFLEMLKDAEELCPNAIVLNYTNPMNIMCLSAGRARNMSVVGLCHSVQGSSHKLAENAGIPYEEMQWACGGINHLAWFTKLEHKGTNVYDILREKVKDRCGEVYESDPVRYDMMLHFGAFITESSGHLSEYLPYYRKRPELIKQYCREGFLGESRFYASNWPQWRKDADTDRMAMLAGEKPIGEERTWEYASWIIEAREKDVPYRIHGNVMNCSKGAYGQGRGELITNLPSDGCVEVACMIDRNGISPTRFGPLPPQLAAHSAANMRMFDLAATACIERSKEAAIHALMLDPLTASVCSTDQIKEMALELFAAEEAFLPGFK